MQMKGLTSTWNPVLVHSKVYTKWVVHMILFPHYYSCLQTLSAQGFHVFSVASALLISAVGFVSANVFNLPSWICQNI